MLTRRARIATLTMAAIGLLTPAAAATPGGEPAPGSPEYIARDIDNIQRADGRQTAPDGQQHDPDYAAARDRAAAAGADDEDPYRVGTWNGIRGQFHEITFADTSSSSGATFTGRVYAPLDGAAHPDTGEPLEPPYPGVVIVPGTNLSSGNFAWAAEDWAERGYVALTFTVPPPQGAGRYFAAAKDAVDFFWSTPSAPSGGQGDAFNPYWQLFDRRPQAEPETPGRPYRFALAGHSIGAAAVSALGNMDQRVSALVAWDRLIKSNAYFVGGETGFNPGHWQPTVPALGVHSEYFLKPTPYSVACALPFGCEAYPPNEAPPPDRELSVAFGGDDGWGIVPPQPGGWAAAGIDVMLLVLRSSTHSEYVDGPDTHASRYGKAVASYYQTAWLDRYLKQDRTADPRLAATTFRQLEPRARGAWVPTPELRRDEHLSIYFCSAWRYHTLGGALVDRMDPAGVGCDRDPASSSPSTSGAATPQPTAGLPLSTSHVGRAGSCTSRCDDHAGFANASGSVDHAGAGDLDESPGGAEPLALTSTGPRRADDARSDGPGGVGAGWAWSLGALAGTVGLAAGPVRRQWKRASLRGHPGATMSGSTLPRPS